MASAGCARNKLLSISTAADPLILLRKLKFDQEGCDPLNPKRDLNLIEQLNQIFTYWATFEAAGYLWKKHEVTSLTFHLGTTAGWDIETADNGGIAAEVFSAVTPQNNSKLRKDVAKVSRAGVKHKYVFYSCPGYTPGIQPTDTRHPDVMIVSVGIYGDTNPQEM